MKTLFVFVVLLSSLTSYGQQAATVSLSQLQEKMTGGDKIVVVNFWATWCAPCVKELPLFEKLNSERSDQVKVTLVSMDLELDPNPEKVYKFISRKNLRSEVVLLNEKDSNSWISKIEKNWSGALPATIIYNPKTGQRKFVEKELHEGDLEKLIAEVQQ